MNAGKVLFYKTTWFLFYTTLLLPLHIYMKEKLKSSLSKSVTKEESVYLILIINIQVFFQKFSR